jgi:serine protease AprX
MRKIRLIFAPLLASVLLVPTLGPAAAGASSLPTSIVLDSNLKIHPLLQYGAQTTPTTVVRVIIQQVHVPSTGLLSGLLGGGSTSSGDEQFTVIPALVKSVQLSTLATLAKDPNVRYISPDGPVQVIPGRGNSQGLVGGVLGLVGGLLTGLLGGGSSTSQPTVSGNFSASNGQRPVSSTNLSTTYPFDTGAQSAWAGAAGPADFGAGTTVAVLDSGVDLTNTDLAGHVIAVNVNASAKTAGDGYGHGTHVAGIIGGQALTGEFVGIAPKANIVSVKISDDLGQARESDVLRGLQWVSQHRSSYNIRALNVSFSTSVPSSYATSPVDAAVETLWHQGVTVVAAAGNYGSDEDAVWYAPGNDPLVITVGCLDENQTVTPGDDSLCPISSRGKTEDGFTKPDMLAPGRKIVSTLSVGANGQPAILATEFPDRISADGHHIRLSGTSMSTPMVTGAVALLLARHPSYTPDQIKRVLVSTANAYPGQVDSAGELDIVGALLAINPGASIQTPRPVDATAAPAGATTLLYDGSHWANSYWTSGRWESGRWESGRWESTYWDSGRWESTYWDSGRWESGNFDSGRWESGRWESGRWESGRWESSTYD